MDLYEKKLKEALNSNNTSFNVKCWIRNHFPELTESEDDRIRKQLIRIVSSHNTPKWYGLEVSKVLAWLEKQGEHQNFREKIQVGDQVTRNEDGVLVNLSQLKRVAKPCEEKKGEQKPTAEEVLIKAGLKPYKDGNQWCILVGDNIQFHAEAKWPIPHLHVCS